MTFQDHFSKRSGTYAKYRPDYPQALYEFILAHVKETELAWDCATGNGQVAVALARHFKKVIATDASQNQIAHAIPHPRVEYRVSAAEDSGLNDHGTDLITVAQALHWFDFDAFYKEVKRVGKPGSLIAVWTYGLLTTETEADQVIQHFYYDIIGKYWPPERQYVDQKYETIPFPFEEIPHPDFRIELSYSLDELTGYLGTWSGTQKYIQETQQDPLSLIREALETSWGNSLEKKQVIWPLVLKMGYIS